MGDTLLGPYLYLGPTYALLTQYTTAAIGCTSLTGPNIYTADTTHKNCMPYSIHYVGTIYPLMLVG